MSTATSGRVYPDDARAARENAERREECWDGVVVMSPIPNNDHQRLIAQLAHALASVVDDAGLGRTYPGVNLTDRTVDWRRNYRVPDVAVYLNTNMAIDRGTHYLGGPDLAVENVSPGEDPHAKLGFFATVDTRELLVVHRDPWALELFTFSDRTHVLAGTSDLPDSFPVASGVTGLTFCIVTGSARPQIEIAHAATGRTWRA